MPSIDSILEAKKIEASKQYENKKLVRKVNRPLSECKNTRISCGYMISQKRNTFPIANNIVDAVASITI